MIKSLPFLNSLYFKVIIIKAACYWYKKKDKWNKRPRLKPMKLQPPDS